MASATSPPRATPLAGAADEAALERLLAQQAQAAAAQQRALQQLITGEELVALASINTAANTKRIKEIDTIRIVTLGMVVVSLLIYAAYIYFSIEYRYRPLINAIAAAKRANAFTFDVSPWFIPFAYEYPIFAGVRFLNRSFPAAVVFSWYTKPYSDYARTDFNKWLPYMFNYAQHHQDANANDILCAVGRQYNIPHCFPPCPPQPNTTLDFLTSAFTFGSQGAFLGNMAGPEGSAVGAVVGFIAGGLAGGALSYFRDRSARAQCGSATRCDADGHVRVCS
jgi:hypothetical protein